MWFLRPIVAAINRIAVAVENNYSLSIRIERLETRMSELADKIKAIGDAEASTEARVTAHENALKQTAADLQAQIDDLKGKVASPDDLAGLQAIADHLTAFDPDAAPA